MRSIWLLAFNDLRRTARDRPAFIWMVLMPIAMMWFFGNMGGGGGSANPPQVSLDVVDRDGGWLAEALVEELEDEGLRMRRLTPDERAVAQDRYRALVIPEGFTEGVLAGEQRTLRLEKEPGSSQDLGLARCISPGRSCARSADWSSWTARRPPETMRGLRRFAPSVTESRS